MRNLTYLLLLFSLLLGGCSPLISFEKNKTSPISLESCTIANGSIQAECGYLHVLEDRNNPNSRILDLKVVVLRASGPDRLPDPLFHITGGPGGADTADKNIADYHVIFGKINAQRDLVFLDQRGTNEEHRLSCEPIPSDVSDGTQQQMNDWMKQCLSNLDGDPRFLTTAEAMRDLDDARAALGYDKINLYGVSYGASAAQVYMRMFPKRVRAVVLDHGTALDLPFFYAKPRASQSALDQLFAYCDQDEKCHTAYPDIRGDWQAILARLAKGPVVTSYTPPGAKDPMSITPAMLEESIHSAIWAGNYGIVPYAIHLFATSEDWTPVVEKALSGEATTADDRLQLMGQVIFCFEPAWGFDLREITRLNPGSFYLDSAMDSAKLQQKICAALPKPDSSLIYGPGKPAPLSALMLNSLLDPQNPPSNMDLALKEFTKSRVVVEPTEGHVSNYPPECRWNIMTQYIEQGSVDGLDISCMEKQKPSFVIGD